MKDQRSLICFDFDGVIVDTTDICFEVTRMRDPSIDKTRFLELFEGNIHEALEKGLVQIKNPIDFPAEYSLRIQGRKPFSAIPPVLEELSNGFHTAIISANSEEVIRRYLADHGLTGRFHMVIGHETEKRKTKMLERALSAFSVERKNAVMITDTLGDLKEAAHAGVRALAVLWGFHSREVLSRGNPLSFLELPSQIPPAVRAALSF